MILVITLFLQWGDNIFTHNFFSDNQIETCCGSSDFSNHCCSQSECYEEDNLINISKVKSGNFSVIIHIFPFYTCNYNNNLTSSIWQPPKIS
jgi:hypothetical protein